MPWHNCLAILLFVQTYPQLSRSNYASIEPSELEQGRVNEVPRRSTGFETGFSGLRVWCPSHSATAPQRHCAIAPLRQSATAPERHCATAPLRSNNFSVSTKMIWHIQSVIKESSCGLVSHVKWHDKCHHKKITVLCVRCLSIRPPHSENCDNGSHLVTNKTSRSVLGLTKMFSQTKNDANIDLHSALSLNCPSVIHNCFTRLRRPFD